MSVSDEEMLKIIRKRRIDEHKNLLKSLDPVTDKLFSDSLGMDNTYLSEARKCYDEFVESLYKSMVKIAQKEV